MFCIVLYCIYLFTFDVSYVSEKGYTINEAIKYIGPTKDVNNVSFVNLFFQTFVKQMAICHCTMPTVLDFQIEWKYMEK